VVGSVPKKKLWLLTSDVQKPVLQNASHSNPAMEKYLFDRPDDHFRAGGRERFNSISSNESDFNFSDVESNPSKKRRVGDVQKGRWTKEEHRAFLIGLKLYGREWKKVAQRIKTRTSAQIRSHAQKYFAKLSKKRYDLQSTSTADADRDAWLIQCVETTLQALRERRRTLLLEAERNKRTQGPEKYSVGTGMDRDTVASGHKTAYECIDPPEQPPVERDEKSRASQDQTRRRLGSLRSSELLALQALCSTDRRECDRSMDDTISQS